MLLSAGVTTGWHLAQVAQQAFGDEICLHLCDTNPHELVPAAALGGAFHRVLPLADPAYEQQILDLLRRTQELERQKGVLCGFVLIVLGIASSALSKTTGGTDVQNFISGVLMGLSVAEILAGIWTAGKALLKQ